VKDHPEVPQTPVYWEQGYIKHYKEFMRAFIHEYGDKPWVSYIRFGIGYGAEDIVCNHYNEAPFRELWIVPCKLDTKLSNS
jgi:hypothetical protein